MKSPEHLRICNLPDMSWSRHFLFLLLGIIACFAQAQNTLGPKIQVYPAGYIVSAKAAKVGRTNEWNVQTGYNFARRQDFGRHDNEEGGGPGLGIGYRKYLSSSAKGIYLGANMDVWLLRIDWRDRITTFPAPAFDTGTTHITVLQPTVGAGYQYLSVSGLWSASAGVAFGREWNIITNGEPVGQGGISLLVFTMNRKL